MGTPLLQRLALDQRLGLSGLSDQDAPRDAKSELSGSDDAISSRATALRNRSRITQVIDRIPSTPSAHQTDPHSAPTDPDPDPVLLKPITIRIPPSLWRWILWTRLGVFLIANACIRLGQPFDSSSDLLQPPQPTSALDRWLKSLFGVFLRWDAVYFHQVAVRGYWYEQEYAFFPLLPFLIEQLRHGAYHFIPGSLLSPATLTLVLGVLLSNFFFVLAATELFRLTRIMFPEDSRVAKVSALFYILNPANSFMSSIYTEPLFAYLAFLGMRFYHQDRFGLASACWTLATSTRSNGILLMGFFLYSTLPNSRPRRPPSTWLGKILRALFFSLPMLLALLLIQFNAFEQFCISSQSKPRPWCLERFPMIYTFVQRTYWNNGFLKYYQWHQLPNFLVALPYMLLTLHGLSRYITADPRRFFTLGIGTLPSAVPLKGYLDDRMLPHIFLWLGLMVLCTGWMHVQIMVRLFSSLPAFFWNLAHIEIDADRYRKVAVQTLDKGAQWSILRKRPVMAYFVLYGLASVVLFSLFYPPA